MEEDIKYPIKQSLFHDIKNFFFRLLKLRRSPVIRLYNGFGNNTHCIIYGHALAISPIERKRFHNNFITNSLALLRLFIVKPMGGMKIVMSWEGNDHTAITEKDGFFKIEWKPESGVRPGTYMVKASLLHKRSGVVLSTDQAELIVPAETQYSFISDIDDTFLISHSSNLRKRLFVLLTENPRSRKPFDGVVNHYRQLSMATATNGTVNPFFYVSSSEWNLYEYIREFSSQNQLPKGVYLLNQLKQVSQVFKTGQNNHSGKFTRIIRILEAFPMQQFILLGDDSQEDPNIYASVVTHFPGKIACVYIRAVHKAPKPHVKEKLSIIESSGVPCCYFNHSEEAIHHSRSLGIIPSKTYVGDEAN